METNQKYMIDDKGKLHREGEVIGLVDEDGNIKLKPESKKYVSAVTRWYNQLDAKPEQEPAAEITERPKLTPEEQVAADMKGVEKEAQEEAIAYKKDWQDDVAFGEKIGQPVPKKNPKFGDKTPAYVEWLKKYRPEKWAEKYGYKGEGQVPVFELNKETGVEEFNGYKDATFTRRKTHMTEKPETNVELDESMDWDA
mgnify:CR=1 FL=1